MQDNIIQFKKKQKLFKNASKINLQTGQVDLVDILVEDENFVAIEKVGQIDEKDCEVVDLCGHFVMPPFVNVFCDSVKALEKTYGLEIEGLKVEQAKEKLKKLGFDGDDNMIEACPNVFMAIKNLLSGVTLAFDMALEKHEEMQKLKCVEHFDEYADKELDGLVESASKNKTKLFLKIGQDLDELGPVDKAYHKPISQVLEDFGFLDRKPIIVGGNCLEKDELRLLKDYDCDFVICPSEDGKEGRRFTNLNALKSLDFNVGIGSGYSFEIDYFAYMRQILMNMRSLYENKNILTEQEVLLMATDNGAKIVLGKPIKIEVGQKADFIVVRKETSLYDDIFKILVWEKSKRDVLLTVFHGKILQKNGEILMKNGTKYDKIKMLVKKYSQKIKNDEI